MATLPTKILLYDLDDSLVTLIQDLIKVQGTTYDSIYDRLTNIDTELMDEDTKKVVQDLIDGYNSSKKLTIQRIKEIEFAIEVALTDAANGSEEFIYDEDFGNVTKHTVKDAAGTAKYEITYNYKSLEEGTLSYSEKKFKDAELKDVTVKKDYTYDEAGNITKIVTSTTIV